MIRVIITALIFFITYGVAFVLASRTLINTWIPPIAAMAIAAISGMAMADKWKAVTVSSKPIINYLCHIIITTGILLAGFYVSNYALADKSTTHPVKAVIDRRYHETRYKSRRIRRNVYGRGEPYKVYFIEMRFDNGMKKSRELPLKEFRHTHKGDTVIVDIATGLYSIPVIK